MVFSKYQRAIISLITAAILWAVAVVLVKQSIEKIPPFTFTFFRFLFASIFFSPIIIAKRKKLLNIFPKIFPISILATLNLLLFTYGIQFTTADMSQIIVSGVPLMTIIILSLVYKEKFPLIKIAGSTIGFLGILFIVALPILEQKAGGNIFAKGNLFIITGFVCWSFYNVLGAKKLKEYLPLYITIIFIVSTAFITFLFALAEYYYVPSWSWVLIYQNIGSMVFTGVFGTSITYFLYQYAVRNSSPFIASLKEYIQPIATFIASFLILGERLTPLFLTGSFIVFIGLFISTDFQGKISRIKRRAAS